MSDLALLVALATTIILAAVLFMAATESSRFN